MNMRAELRFSRDRRIFRAGLSAASLAARGGPEELGRIGIEP